MGTVTIKPYSWCWVLPWLSCYSKIMISEKYIFNVCWHLNVSEIQPANWGSKFLQNRVETMGRHVSKNCNRTRMCCYLHDSTTFLSSTLHAEMWAFHAVTEVYLLKNENVISVIEGKASKSLLMQAAFYFWWWAHKLFEAVPPSLCL